MSDKLAVSILGTGECARALAARFLDSGVSFTLGSRDPSRLPSGPRQDILEKSPLYDIQNSITSADIVIVAWHPEHHVTLKTYESQLSGKILVDVSNPTSSVSSEELSGAEKLASMFPRSEVVKAFNTLSAQSMYPVERFSQPPPVCHVCSDYHHAKREVSMLACRLGFYPQDGGVISNSRRLEKKAREVFPEWRLPVIVVSIVFAFWIVLASCRNFVLRTDLFTYDRMPSNVFNKIAGAVAMTTYSIVYFPGCIAAFRQLASGPEKSVELSRFLTRWLSIRRQLGLLALMFACVHAILSSCLMSPAYFGKWFQKSYVTVQITGDSQEEEVKIPIAGRMNWLGEMCIMFAVLAFACLSILGITSLHSVASTFGRREWRFVRSHLGVLALLLITSHVTAKGAWQWRLAESPLQFLVTVTFISCVPAWITLVMRLILYLIMLYKHVDRVFDRRRERESSNNKNSRPRYNNPKNSEFADLSVSIIV